MDALKQYISEQMAGLLASYEMLEMRGCIDEKSYALEFFVTINGERKQCYEMVDQGELNEDRVDEIIQSIARFARTLPDYVCGELYSLNVTITSEK